jgi:hypothetical protein
MPLCHALFNIWLWKAMFYGYSEGLILPLQLVVTELEGSINVFHSCKKHSECALSYTLWDSGVLFVRCTQCELVLKDP